MEKFIPYEKLSKKKKRELDTLKRGSWNGFNPVTRKPANPKAYNRKKAQSRWSDYGDALSLLLGGIKKATAGFLPRWLVSMLLFRF